MLINSFVFALLIIVDINDANNFEKPVELLLLAVRCFVLHGCPLSNCKTVCVKIFVKQERFFVIVVLVLLS